MSVHAHSYINIVYSFKAILRVLKEWTESIVAVFTKQDWLKPFFFPLSLFHWLSTYSNRKVVKTILSFSSSSTQFHLNNERRDERRDAGE